MVPSPPRVTVVFEGHCRFSFYGGVTPTVLDEDHNLVEPKPSQSQWPKSYIFDTNGTSTFTIIGATKDPLFRGTIRSIHGDFKEIFYGSLCQMFSACDVYVIIQNGGENILETHDAAQMFGWCPPLDAEEDPSGTDTSTIEARALMIINRRSDL